MAELAKLREITLDGCSMSVQDIDAFQLAIFNQTTVNVERISFLQEDDPPQRSYPLPHEQYWTDRMRKELDRGFCIEFS